MRTLPSQDPLALDQALDILGSGGLVVLPTDTVYGVGVRAYDEVAIEKLYALKGRDPHKPIPVLVAGYGSLPLIARNIPRAATLLANHFWPGPLTLVVEKDPDLPDALTHGATVGVRAPDQEFTLALLQQSGPLAVTSANFSGESSVSEIMALPQSFRRKVDLIVDAGQTPGGVASTVIDCTRQPIQLLRIGPISFESVLEVCQEDETRS